VAQLRVDFDMTPALVSGAGIGRYASELAEALTARDDVDLHVEQAYGGAASGAAGRVARGLWREGLYYPLLLGRRARRARAQLVHCPAPYGVRTGGVPLILAAHDVLPLRHPELFTRAMVLHMRHVSARHLRRAERVTCGSEHVRRELIELVGVRPERARVVPYGVPAGFRPMAADRERLRERFGIEGEYVLCVGTLEPRKNLRVALQAYRGLGERRAGLSLVMAGGRGWRNEAFERELAESPDGVVMTGRVTDDELVELYAGAACFLFPSLGEGIGLPLLEAMSCGTPVIASDRTSLPELVGDAGLLVDPSDSHAIGAAIARILDEPQLAAELRERGLRRSERHTWGACAEATVAVYRDALAERV
jgi:glycosyltransferase involved in cell wall biosynthesis